MANNNAIASVRRYMGITQGAFAAWAGNDPKTYGLHERMPDQFRVRELQGIADRLNREQRLLFASAVLQTIFGTDMEAKERL